MTLSSYEDDLAAAIDTALAAFTLGTNLYTGPERPTDKSPSRCIFVLPTGGLPARHYRSATGAEVRYPRAQVLVRSERGKFDQGKDDARAAYAALHRQPPAGYIEVEVLESEPSYIGTRESGEHRWTFNVQVTKEE